MQDVMAAGGLLDGVRLVDHHCHGVVNGDLDRAGFELLATEAAWPAPAGCTGFDSQVGFAIRRFGIPVLPLILGVILGPLMELKLREALDLSGGDLSGLFNEPLAVFVYVLIALAIVLPIVLGRLRRSQPVPETKEEVSR